MSAAARIAFFVSPHGLGHAARSAALIEELARQRSDLEFLVVTSAPEWFFRASLDLPFEYVHAEVDVGLVQRTATEEDLDATVAALGRLYSCRSPRLTELVSLLHRRRVAAVVADISPLALEAGRIAGVPTVLVENFTWDWIYRGYGRTSPALSAFADTLAELFALADLHLQTTPVCHPVSAAVRVGAISRRPRAGRDATRARLGVAPAERLVTLSMGGIPVRFDVARAIASRPERFLLIGETGGALPGNVLSIPHRSAFHHPDLLLASDVVVGKLGYSTVAEAWRAGVDWLWIDRPAFPETAVLAEHVRRHHRQVRLEPDALSCGDWTAALDLLTGPLPAARYEDGAPDAAAAILRRI